MNFKDIAVRYGISTAGLVLIAMGVGLSIKSNLGVAPPSCPPTILNLQWTPTSAWEPSPGSCTCCSSACRP